MSSHLLTEVQHLVDDVVVINGGRLVTSGTVADLTNSSALVRSPDAASLAPRLASLGGRVETSDAETLVVADLALDVIGRAARDSGAVLHELSPRASSLEDVFFALTSSATTQQEAAS